MAPFYGCGSIASKLEPLRGGSLLFTTKFPEISGIHFIDMEGWKADSSLEPPSGFEHGNYLEEAVYFPGTHLIDIGSLKDWVVLGAIQWFWTRDPWIGNPAPNPAP